MIAEDMRELNLMAALERDLNFFDVRLLAKGSFGAVFKCSRDSQTLALKVVLKEQPNLTTVQRDGWRLQKKKLEFDYMA